LIPFALPADRPQPHKWTRIGQHSLIDTAIIFAKTIKRRIQTIDELPGIRSKESSPVRRTRRLRGP
jgi:hypothetical protein